MVYTPPAHPGIYPSLPPWYIPLPATLVYTSLSCQNRLKPPLSLSSGVIALLRCYRSPPVLISRGYISRGYISRGVAVRGVDVRGGMYAGVCTRGYVRGWVSTRVVSTRVGQYGVYGWVSTGCVRLGQ